MEEEVKQTAETDPLTDRENGRETEEKTARQPEEEKPEKGHKNRNQRKMDALRQDNEKIAQEKAEIHDKYIRLYSEFDNYRRRTQREKLDLIKNASEQIIVGLLPVLDDMERALQYSAQTEGEEAEKEGMSLIYNTLKTFLTQQGLEAIQAIGEPFDVDLHEAVTTVPAEKEEDKGRVLDEIQKGYKLNEKVIRFSKVVIYQ